MRSLVSGLRTSLLAIALGFAVVGPGVASAQQPQCHQAFGGRESVRVRKDAALFEQLSGWPVPLQRMSRIGVFDRYWDSADAKEIVKKMMQRRSSDVGYWGPDFMLRLRIVRDAADPSILRVEIPGLFFTENNQQSKTGSRPSGLDTSFVRALAGVLKGIEKELKSRNDIRGVILAGTDIRNPMLIEGMTKAGFQPYETTPGTINLGVHLTLVGN